MRKAFPGTRVRFVQTSFRLAASALCLAVAHARSPLNLSAIQRDGYGVVELKQPVSNEFFLEGTLNGHPIRLVLDTGFCADHIMMTNQSARFLRTAPQPIKGSGHSVTGKTIEHLSQGIADSMTLGNVQVAGATIHFGSFRVLAGHAQEGLWYTDGMLGNERAVRNDSDGFLGLGFLRRCSAIIDLSNRRLYLKAPGTGRTPQLGPALKSVGYSEAPIEVTGDGLLVDVSINGVSGKMIVDTGADISLVDGRFATRANLKRYMSGNMVMRDAAGVETKPEWADPASFKVGGVEAFHPKLEVEPVSFADASGGRVIGLLGMDFMGQSWGIIDFALRKFYFVPTR